MQSSTMLYVIVKVQELHLSSLKAPQIHLESQLVMEGPLHPIVTISVKHGHRITIQNLRQAKIVITPMKRTAFRYI